MGASTGSKALREPVTEKSPRPAGLATTRTSGIDAPEADSSSNRRAYPRQEGPNGSPPLSQRNCVPTSVSNQPRVSVRRRCDESMETARGNSEAVDWVPTRRERSPTKGNCERAAQASHPEKPTRQSTRGHRSPLRWNRNRLVRKATTDGMGRGAEGKSMPTGQPRGPAATPWMFHVEHQIATSGRGYAGVQLKQPEERPRCSTWNISA